MNLSLVEQVARAVLYEGYILYPYRASAVKNRQRWNFGVLSPPAFSFAGGENDPHKMQTQCLLLGAKDAAVDIRIRFLHLVTREIGKLPEPLAELAVNAEPAHSVVESLEVDGKIFQAWQEAEERDVFLPGLKLRELTTQAHWHKFQFPAKREWSPILDSIHQTVGIIIRKQESIEGIVEVLAESAGAEISKITIRVANATNCLPKNREDALIRSMVSTHTILNIHDGEFVSLLDPPNELSEIAGKCHNVGTWPVLVGAEGERDTILSSPIILYDYPQVAPESAGDLFDSTEIDEILTLRILTLTEEEKQEARQTDERARELLERAESLPAEQFQKLHGVVRSLHHVKEKKE
jgi:hydrogenase maturation protease